MRQFLLVTLFGILLSDIMLGLGLTLGPGLSLKNAMLYIVFLGLMFEFTLGARDPLHKTFALSTAWLSLIFYATFTWLVIILLGIHRGYSPFEGFIALKAQLIDLFLFLLVYMYAPKDRQVAYGLLCWLIAILAVANIVTMMDVFNLPDLGIISEGKDGRLTGPVNEVNQYGAILIFIIPVTAGLAIGSEGWRKRLFAIGTLVAFVLLGLTVSRGSYLGLVVGSLVALYLVRDHVNRAAILKGFLVITMTLIVVAIAIAYQNPEGFMAQFDFVGTSLDRASSGRIDFWRQALTMMSQWAYSFVLGFGWNAYATLFLGYGDPHNTYLLYWFNLGIIGLGLYVFITLWIVRFSVSSLGTMSASMKPVAIGFIIGFLSLHAALFFVNLYSSWLFIWAISGAVLRLIIEDRKGDNDDVTDPENSESRSA